MAEDKEWYTQKEIADQLGVPVRSLYGKISTLRTAGVIQWKEDPEDQRAILIHKDSIQTIGTTVKDTSKPRQKDRPHAHPTIKRDDEKLISVSDAIKKYDLDEEWVKKNLTRLVFPGSKTIYLYIPELEYALEQVEFIPPEEG